MTQTEIRHPFALVGDATLRHLCALAQSCPIPEGLGHKAALLHYRMVRCQLPKGFGQTTAAVKVANGSAVAHPAGPGAVLFVAPLARLPYADARLYPGVRRLAAEAYAGGDLAAVRGLTLAVAVFDGVDPLRGGDLPGPFAACFEAFDPAECLIFATGQPMTEVKPPSY
jgi:hypothetical protein